MKDIKPLRLLFISFFVWLFFYVQMPVEYLYDGSLFFPLFTLISFITFFAFGVYSLKSKSLRSIPLATESKIRQIIVLFFIIGSLGVMLKLYVGVFNTGIFVAEDTFEKRLENMGQELTGGFVGIIASVLFPFAYVSMLLAIYNYKIISKYLLVIIVLFGLYPFVETIFMGGRTIIALLGTTLLFVIYASYNKNANLPTISIKYLGKIIVNLPKFLLKRIVYIPLLLISVLFVTYSIDVVNKRLTRFGYGNKTFQVWERKDYQWVKFDEDFKKDYFNSNAEEKAKQIGIYSLKHYFAHGPVEYVRLVNHLESTTGYYYGQYEFSVFFKFFRAFGVPLKSNEDMQSIISRKAVYQTFFGPFYIDFGIFGIFIIFFWGRFTKRLYIYSLGGHSQYVVFYGYIATILITSAFLNFLLGSSSYYLFAFFMSLLVFKIWPNNLRIIYRK
ncbi:MAG: hypothetical protein Tsb0033_01100 [Winogradskyella sp.]